VSVSTQPPAARRSVPLALATLGGLAFVATIPWGPQAILAGAVVLLLACLLALLDTSVPVFTWPNAMVTLVLLVWFVPIKTYSLPTNLPFELEPYRLYLLVLVFVWLVGVGVGRSHLSAGGQAYPLVFLTAVLFATQIVNFKELNAGSTEPEALKSLSYFLSFIIVFLLVSSTLDSASAVDTVVRTLVAGAGVVAVFTLYDSRFSYNVFEHLHEWVPVLEYNPPEVDLARGGLLRVYASAQHPIALSVALLLVVPLAIYLAGRAASTLRSCLWIGIGLLCTAGALATVSRTTVVMLVAMTLVALFLRGKAMVRFWPLLLILPVAVHFLSPGALGGIYKSFFPQEGLFSTADNRAGLPGSGRLSDIRPGLEIWSQSPLVGIGLTELTVPSDLPAGVEEETHELIFDDQYLNTLVTMGGLGLVAVVWFVWGSVIKLIRATRRRLGQPSDLLVACSASAASFAASMFLFDAFGFVQCTLIFFMIVAIGLKTRALSPPTTDLRAV
jgi:hypothetical protein